MKGPVYAETNSRHSIDIEPIQNAGIYGFRGVGEREQKQDISKTLSSSKEPMMEKQRFDRALPEDRRLATTVILDKIGDLSDLADSGGLAGVGAYLEWKILEEDSR